MTPGEFVVVRPFPLSMPMGAKVLASPLPAGVPDDVVWLDVSTLGTHLPQMYRRSEIEAMPPDPSTVGLCAGCQGYGDLGDPPVAASVDQLDRPCPDCAGSGRAAVRIHLTRTPSGVMGRVEILPHSFVSDDATCFVCGEGSDHEHHKETS